MNNSSQLLKLFSLAYPDKQISIEQQWSVQHIKTVLQVLAKRVDQRVTAEIDSFLIPLLKKVQWMKEQKMKDSNLYEIANSLRYETYPKETVISDDDKAGHVEKFYIVVSGKVHVQKAQPTGTINRNTSQASSQYSTFMGGKDGLLGTKSHKALVRYRFMTLEHQGDKYDMGHSQTIQFELSHPLIEVVTIPEDQDIKIEDHAAELDAKLLGVSPSKEKIDEANIFGPFQSFGENALTKLKPEKLKIKCLTETHLAVLSKQDYFKCLAKFEAKAITKTLYFLQELPFFKTWSKTQLNKLLSSFKTVRFFRGQVIFKEGCSNDDIYIVRNGEFSANRTMILKNQNVNQSVMQFLRGQKTHSTLRSVFNPQFNQLTTAPSITNASKTKEQMQLFLFGKGQIFGEERFVREEQLTPYTAMCSSLEGECLKISSSDFMKKVYLNQDAMKVLKSNLNQKEQKIQYKQVSGIYNNIWIQKSNGNSAMSVDQFADKAVSKMLTRNNYKNLLQQQ